MPGPAPTIRAVLYGNFAIIIFSIVSLPLMMRNNLWRSLHIEAFPIDPPQSTPDTFTTAGQRAS